MVEFLCAHDNIEYRAQNDNYYCASCNVGFGQHYYRLAKREAQQAERIRALEAALREAADELQRAGDHEGIDCHAAAARARAVLELRGDRSGLNAKGAL